MSAAYIPSAEVDPATLPDLDRAHPAGLTWVEPLVPRPIALGPSNNHPDLRPALAIDVAAFWSHARHGLAVGRAEIEMDQAVMRQALAANPRQGHLRAAVAETSAQWDRAINEYVKEIS